MILPAGSHDYRKPVAPAPKPVAPSIEDLGNGWFRVYGSVCGPMDRASRADAEATLAGILSRRADAAIVVPSTATRMGH